MDGDTSHTGFREDYQGVFICSSSFSHQGRICGPAPNNTLSPVGSTRYTEIAKDFPQETTSASDHVASPQEFEDVTAPMASAVPKRINLSIGQHITDFFGFMQASEFTAANDSSFNEQMLCEKDIQLRRTWWCSTYECPRQTHVITAAM